MALRGQWRDGWHVVPYQVVFRDLDAFRHVNNAVFFTYFEWGRTAYWLDLMGLTEATSIGFIVARAECDFRAQLELEEIEVATRISEMRNTSATFLTEIRRKDGVIASNGKVVVVFFDWESNSKTPISEEFKAKVRNFQGG